MGHGLWPGLLGEAMTIVTMTRLNQAALDVQGELNQHGFWDDATAGPDVYLVPFGYACSRMERKT